MAPDVAAQTTIDAETLFIHLWRRLANRFNRFMEPGYLAWAQTHAPELWRRREAARQAWDTNERLESMKSGRISWRDYRRLMLAWARVEVKAIRCHRRHLAGVKRHAA